MYYSCTPASVVEALTLVLCHPRMKTNKYPDNSFHPEFPVCFSFW